MLCTLSWRKKGIYNSAFSFRRDKRKYVIWVKRKRSFFYSVFILFRRIDLYYGSDEEHVPNLTVTEKEFIIPFSHSAGLIKSILYTWRCWKRRTSYCFIIPQDWFISREWRQTCYEPTVTEKEFIIPFSHSAGLIKNILCTCWWRKRKLLFRFLTLQEW